MDLIDDGRWDIYSIRKPAVPRFTSYIYLKPRTNWHIKDLCCTLWYFQDKQKTVAKPDKNVEVLVLDRDIFAWEYVTQFKSKISETWKIASPELGSRWEQWDENDSKEHDSKQNIDSNTTLPHLTKSHPPSRK